MRHAHQSGGPAPDHERPLTERGRAEAHSVGQRLADETPRPMYVLSSTALRCRETWMAVAAGLGSSITPDFDSSLYNASSKELAQAIAGVGDEVESLLVLAHNPGISMLALGLGQSDPANAETLGGGFSPATTARFEVDGPWSTLSGRTARLLAFHHL